MKTVRFAVLGLALSLFMVAWAYSADEKDKEKTLKGTICCAKCELKLEAKCHTTIKVKEADKDVVYYFDDASSKKYHKDICTQTKEGSVTGTVSEKDKKKIVKVSKLEYK